MVRANNTFEKRQRELAKKIQKEGKRLKKQGTATGNGQSDQSQSDNDTTDIDVHV